MEFFVFLFVLFVIVQVVKGISGQGQPQRPLPPPSHPGGSAEGEQVIRIGPFSIPIPPEARAALEQQQRQLPASPGSWWEVDEPEEEPVRLDPAAPEPVEVALYHPPAPMSVEARPLPPAPVTLDGEVDRDAEHARLHARIDRPRRAAAPAPRRVPAHPASALGDLRDPAALRRAVLAAEVLGPPRALRPLGD